MIYTVQELAKLWKVSPACIYALVTDGLLECHRIGTGRGTIRITAEQADRYLEGTRSLGKLPDDLHHINVPK